jgi:hypothetical protein
MPVHRKDFDFPTTVAAYNATSFHASDFLAATIFNKPMNLICEDAPAHLFLL